MDSHWVLNSGDIADMQLISRYLLTLFIMSFQSLKILQVHLILIGADFI